MRLFAAEPRSIAGLLFPFQYLCGMILVTHFVAAQAVAAQAVRQENTGSTLSGRTGSALAWHSEGRTFASQSVQ